MENYGNLSSNKFILSHTNESAGLLKRQTDILLGAMEYSELLPPSWKSNTFLSNLDFQRLVLGNSATLWQLL